MMDSKFLLWLVFCFTRLARSLPKVLLVHNGHEGSHAICEAMHHHLCVAVDCSEQFDAWQNDGRANWNGLRRSPARVVLFRAPKHELLSHVRSEHAILVLVRTDLMRWAISLYFKRGGLPGSVVDERLADPQFFNVTETLETYDLTLLSGNARECVGFWREKVALLDALRLARARYAVMTYEQFLAAGAKYLARVLDAVEMEHSHCSAAVHAFIPRSARRVHGDNISRIALNADDILRHFITTTYPTWSLVGGDRHADHHPA